MGVYPHGPSYGNIVEYYHFVIPSIPGARQTYGLHEISLVSFSSRPKDIATFSSGNIVIDPQKKETVVSIRTATGDFPGNGTYPLSLSPHDLPSSNLPFTKDDLHARCRRQKSAD